MSRYEKKEDIKNQAKYRWKSILMAIGVDEKYLNQHSHSKCIVCDQGKDCFRFTDYDGNGSYICSKCGNGTGIDLAMSQLNLNFKETSEYIRQIIGITTVEPVKQPDTEKNTARIKKIHAGLKRITPDNPAGLYLLRRGITEFPQQNAYFHPAVPFYDEGAMVGTFPCLVGMIRTPEGELSTLHITYLNEDGTKAIVPVGKKILPTMLPMTGSAIQLFTVSDVMAIAEGIESALSFTQLEGVPCWSVINAAGISRFSPPEDVTKLYVICDEDKGFTGARAAYEAANRLSVKGMDVCVVRILNREIYLDNSDKFDMNDYLILKAHEANK